MKVRGEVLLPPLSIKGCKARATYMDSSGVFKSAPARVQRPTTVSV